MPPPDQPEKPKPTMPAAAREALAAREAAAKAAAMKISAPKKVAPPPAPVVPAKPRMDVGIVGFVVWLLAAAAALSLFYNFKVAKDYRSFVLPRKITGGVLGGILLMAIWFTQAIEKDVRLVKLVWVIAILTVIAAPVLIFVMRPR